VAWGGVDKVFGGPGNDEADIDIFDTTTGVETLT
jgi:hypothetical protein